MHAPQNGTSTRAIGSQQESVLGQAEPFRDMGLNQWLLMWQCVDSGSDRWGSAIYISPDIKISHHMNKCTMGNQRQAVFLEVSE